MSIYEYALLPEEKISLQKFLSEHEKYCPQIKRKSDYSLCFSHAGGIGTSVMVKCRTCKKEHNITDYDTW